MAETVKNEQYSKSTTTNGVTTTTTTYLRTTVDVTYQTVMDASGHIWEVDHSLIGGFDEIAP